MSSSSVLNFNAGPAPLPASVLHEAQRELLDYHGQGMSILEMSHRVPEYEAINARAEANFKRLIGVGDDGYRVVFMQGGASSQFATVPMNFLTPESTAEYLSSPEPGARRRSRSRSTPRQGPRRRLTNQGGYRGSRVRTRSTGPTARAPTST